MARLIFVAALSFAILLSLLSFSFALTCQQSCKATYDGRVANAEALAAEKGYYWSQAEDNCYNERSARAGEINPCVLAYVGHPAVGISGCVDSCTDPGCASCVDQLQACCLAAGKDSAQIYMDDCLAACGPVDKCADKTCQSRCTGNTFYRGYCDPATGNCLEEQGYCANGCQDNKCLEERPDTSWHEKDTVCEFLKGENCGNSKEDCICASGWKCNIDDPNRNEVGCVQVAGPTPNNNICEYQDGENCATPNDNDCKCSKDESCNPSASGSDNFGCVMTATNPCADVECNDECDSVTINSDVIEYSKQSGRCVSGLCIYTFQACGNGCSAATGRCASTPDVGQAGCNDLGTLLVQTGLSKGSTTVYKQEPDENGVLQSVAKTVSTGGTYCKGDKIVTDSETRVWIKHRDGTITAVGTDSTYQSGKGAKNEKQVSGQVTIDNDFAELSGVVTMVPKDWRGLTPPSNRQDSTAELMKWMGSENYNMKKFKQHSRVIYQTLSDGSERVTVLRGHVTVVDSDGGTFEIGAGQQYTVKPEQKATDAIVANVKLSELTDEIAAMPETGGTLPGGKPGTDEKGCCGTSAILLLIPALFVVSRK